jgi:hypothetical protein
MDHIDKMIKEFEDSIRVKFRRGIVYEGQEREVLIRAIQNNPTHCWELTADGVVYPKGKKTMQKNTKVYFRNDLHLTEREDVFLRYFKKYTYSYTWSTFKILRTYFVPHRRKQRYASIQTKPVVKCYVTFYEFINKYKGNKFLVPDNFGRGYVKDPIIEDHLITYKEAKKLSGSEF